MKTIIIDANNAIWRVALKVPNLSYKGQSTQVVFGFLRLLKNLMDQFEPDVVICCWDWNYSKTRKKIYPEYKANRDHSTKEHSRVIDQIKIVQKILPFLNVVQLESPDVEADDLISIVCCEIEERKIVISSDRDMLQLVNEETSVWSPIKMIHYTHSNFHKLVGMTPRQWVEFRALTGDKGDNIPGVVKGFGEHSARELIIKYGNLERIFTSKVLKVLMNKGCRYALLCEDGTKENAYRNLKLIDLIEARKWEEHKKIPSLLEERLEARKGINRLEVRKQFSNYKFESLLNSFAGWIKPFENLDSYAKYKKVS